MRISIILVLAIWAIAGAQGPVGHWSFDSGNAGVFADDSGSGNHKLVILQKPEALVSITGVSGKAIRFADTGFEAEVISSKGAFNFPSLTIEAVVSVPQASAFIAQYNVYGHDMGLSLARGYSLFFNENRNLEFATGNQDISPIWNECISPVALASGTVHIVAGVLNDAGFDKVYIDGEEMMAVPTKPYLPNLVFRLRVGYGYGNGGLNGYMSPGSAMDDLKLWDRALSSEEMHFHYLAIKDTVDQLNRQPK